MASQADGTGIIVNCPTCDEPVINVSVDGVKSRLSRFTVPLHDALVIGKYGRLVFNIWKGATRLYAVAWFPSQGRPDKGWLFSQHFCYVRR